MMRENLLIHMRTKKCALKQDKKLYTCAVNQIQACCSFLMNEFKYGTQNYAVALCRANRKFSPDSVKLLLVLLVQSASGKGLDRRVSKYFEKVRLSLRLPAAEGFFCGLHLSVAALNNLALFWIENETALRDHCSVDAKEITKAEIEQMIFDYDAGGCKREGSFYHIPEWSDEPCYIGVDNNSRECFVEEFYTLTGLVKWLCGVDLEEIYEYEDRFHV